MIQLTRNGFKEIEGYYKKEEYIFRTKFSQLRGVVLEEARLLSLGTIPTSISKPKRPWALENSNYNVVRRSYKGKVQKVMVPISGGLNFPLLPINEQTSGLIDNFATKLIQYGNTEVIELYNRKRYGKYILSISGTEKMVPRGFQQYLKRRVLLRAKLWKN